MPTCPATVLDLCLHQAEDVADQHIIELSTLESKTEPRLRNAHQPGRQLDLLESDRLDWRPANLIQMNNDRSWLINATIGRHSGMS